MQKAPRSGRSALALLLVLVVGVGAGAAATAYQRPAESRDAVRAMLDRVAGQGAEVRHEDGSLIDAARPPSSGLRSPEMSSETAREPEGPAPRRAARRAPAPSPVPDPGSGLLEDAEVPGRASGKLRTVPGREGAPGDGEVLRVRVAVERGLPVDHGVFADAVMTTLNDRRGWSSVDGVTFARTDTDDHDFRVVLASPRTTDELCHPLDTGGTLSCGVIGTAVLNFRRWVHGSDAWESDARYRQYLVNHEVGHVLGHPHDECAGRGKRGTVMLQQTLSTQGCRPEPWPAPGRR
ncbi:DUF3152 domain-containing protein [Myceligenerans salitolerans]|uniref:DUF3152 domain-containing protein n=1 Tax=Myceligenerans salitolerans TaxID=1230528 RepID=A0ABS3I8U9_9MICO|nr:DUF3152 domain-containing protein [Myceligenerans salitolerans]MBO0608507.1 DUF3152 domain-containing protein [Myceligenerans salitolerans]